MEPSLRDLSISCFKILLKGVNQDHRLAGSPTEVTTVLLIDDGWWFCAPNHQCRTASSVDAFSFYFVIEGCSYVMLPYLNPPACMSNKVPLLVVDSHCLGFTFFRGQKANWD